MNHRRGLVSIADSEGDLIRPGLSYRVRVLSVGAVVKTTMDYPPSDTIPVTGPHSFAVGDKFVRNPLTDNTYSGTATVTAVTYDTIKMSSASFLFNAGDVLINVGPDASNTAPGFQKVKTRISSRADGSDAISNSTVSVNIDGEYEYYYRGDGACWELVQTTSGANVDLIKGWGGVGNRLNVCDYGLRSDMLDTDTPYNYLALRGLATCAPGGLNSNDTNRAEIYFPSGRFYFAAAVFIDRGNISITGDHGALLIVANVSVFLLKFRGDQEDGGRMANVHVSNLHFLDEDPDAHAPVAQGGSATGSNPDGQGSEESHAILMSFVDNFTIRDCHFQGFGDETIDIARCSDGKVVDNHVREGCAVAVITGKGAISINNSSNIVVDGNTIRDTQNGQAIRVEITVAAQNSDNIQITNNIISNPQAVDFDADGAGVGIGVYVGSFGTNGADNIRISGNTITNPARSGIVFNPTAGGVARRCIISENIVDGGGEKTLSAGQNRAGITVIGGATDGIIESNIINSWGTTNLDGTKNYWGIYVKFHGFVIRGNRIIDCDKGILSEGTSTGGAAHGNVISGNYISGGTSTGIRASYRDAVHDNFVRGISGTGSVRGIVTVTDNETTKPTSVAIIGNIVRSVRDTADSDGTGIRPFQQSFAALNLIEDCDRAIVPNDGSVDDGTNVNNKPPVVTQNMLLGNTTNWFPSSAQAVGFWGIQPFGDGMTEASGTGTIADGFSQVDINPNITGFNSVTSNSLYDVRITPNADFGPSTVTRWWITNATSNSQFRVKVSPTCAGGAFTFNWSVIRRTKVDTG